MRQWVLIEKAGVAEALIVHDTRDQRAVYKGDFRSRLYAGISIALTDPAQVLVTGQGPLLVRSKVTPANAEYLPLLLDRCLRPPYQGSLVQPLPEDERLDEAADRLARAHLPG